MRFRILFTILLCAFFTSVQAQHGIGKATKSVLSEGSWYKLSAPVSGVYKIDKAALTAMGLTTSQVNLAKVAVFANRGGMIPETIVRNGNSDLVELPIFIEGEADGRFDDQDYILFY